MFAPITLRHFDPLPDHGTVGELWTTIFGVGSIHNEPEFAIHRQRAVDDELFFVAEASGSVVGTVLAGFLEERGWIYSLAVCPDHRRRGIGRRLLRMAEMALTTRGCANVSLQIVAGSAALAGFYERSGYTVEPSGSMGRRLSRAVR